MLQEQQVYTVNSQLSDWATRRGDADPAILVAKALVGLAKRIKDFSVR
jgi:hypothetical protein